MKYDKSPDYNQSGNEENSLSAGLNPADVYSVLKTAGIENYRNEAKWLCEFAEKTGGNIDALVSRRTGGEPLQYILGEWEFYGYPFKVGPGVLIPRQETELLVDLAKEHKPVAVYDLCAGSGCVGISAARETGCKIIAMEISAEAIAYLKQNISLNNVSDKVSVVKGDVLKPICKFGKSDMILVNPPYLTKAEMGALQKEVAFEPEKALYGGEDGLDFYRKIFNVWGDSLKKGGVFAAETGAEQAETVSGIMRDTGLFEEPLVKKDYSGAERVVCAVKK